MSDTADDMEYNSGKLFCKNCDKHFTECECNEVTK